MGMTGYLSIYDALASMIDKLNFFVKAGIPS